MTGPRRWLDDPNAPHAARALLVVSQAERPLPQTVRADVERSLVALVVAPGLATQSVPHAGDVDPPSGVNGGGAPGELPLGEATGKALSGVKAALVGVAGTGFVGVATVAGYLLFHSSFSERRSTTGEVGAVAVVTSTDASSSAPGTVQRAAPVGTVVPTSSALVTALELPTASSTSVPTREGTQSSSRSRLDPLLHEARSLAAIRALSEPTAQLRRLRNHEQRFPHGQLQAEQWWLRATLELELGHAQEARRALETLLALSPAGPYAPRARAKLAALPRLE